MILDWFKKHIFKLSFIYFAVCLYVLITEKYTFYEAVRDLGIPIIVSVIYYALEYLWHKILPKPENIFLTENDFSDSRLEWQLIFLHFCLFLFLFTDGFDSGSIFFNISFIITIVLYARKFKIVGAMFKSRNP